MWVPFPPLGLLELCQLAVLSPLLPVQDLPCPSLHLFVFFTALWSGLWGFSAALEYALTVPLSVYLQNAKEGSDIV